MTPRHYSIRGKPTNTPLALYDKWLMGTFVTLLIIGLMMVASSSVMISTKFYANPFHFLLHQLCYLFVGLIAALIVMRVDSSLWEKWSGVFLLVSLTMLMLVLIPGIGRSVNGSRRWISLGIMSIQVSEIIKLTMIFYVSGYLVRQGDKVAKGDLLFTLDDDLQRADCYY